MSGNDRFGLGLIGVGSFGLFCLDAFHDMREISIAAVADSDRSRCDEARRRSGVVICGDPDELISRDDVDIVHIATPPSSHYELTIMALRSGKHVLCEKPLSLTTAQADEIVSLAERKDLIAPVNFVLRYNPVSDAVKSVLSCGALGEVLSGRLTNCAFDSLMDADHWFWDKSVSGGIFIEHGVHFFDLYRHWLGPSEVLSAHTEMREGTRQEDRVTCLVRHEGGALVNHYHGFDQVKVMDRTDHRFVCEMGDIRVRGWIPLELTVDAAVDDAGEEALWESLPDGDLEVIERYSGDRGDTMGRGKRRTVTKRIRITYVPESDKEKVYSDSVRDLLTDQLAFVRDRSHHRRITERNGLDALVLAESAARTAQT